jgi:hypothetical protein
MPTKEPPIYVVVMSDDLSGKWLERALAEDPERKPNPIVNETNVNGATLEKAQERAARMEREYGACRVARLVFEDHPAFKED